MFWDIFIKNKKVPGHINITRRGYVRDKRVTEIDYQLKYAIFSTAFSIVYKYCTRPISKFKDPLDTKHKIFKKRLNS